MMVKYDIEMKPEKNIFTQRRKDAKKRLKAFLCVFAPLRETKRKGKHGMLPSQVCSFNRGD
jgi:hypothetical protein